MRADTRATLWGLGLAVVLTAIIADKDWRREAAHESMMEGRGQYGRGKR